MLKQALDKQSIVGGYPTQCKPRLIRSVSIGVVVALLLAACASPDDRTVSAADSSPAPARTAAQEAQLSALLQQAIQADRMGDFEGALPLYQQALELSDDPGVAERVTRIAAETGRWSVAADAANRWRSLAPSSVPAQQMMIVSLMRLGQTDAAIDELAKQVTQTEPTTMSWPMALGLLQVPSAEQNDPMASREDSMVWLNQLLAQAGHSSDSAFAHYQRSRLAWQQGDSDAAYSFARAANTAEPNYVNAMWAAGLAVQQEELEQAQALYAQARSMAESPNSAPAVQAALAEAEVLGQLGRLGQSVALLETLPDSLDTVYARALMELERDRVEAASEHWQTLVGMAEQTEAAQRDRAHWLVAILAEVIGQETDAIDWYGRVEGDNRDTARLRQAGLLALNGRLDEARQLLAALREDGDPQLTEQTYLVESQLLLEQDQPDAALDLLIEAVSNQPSSLDLLYGRAMAAVQNGQLDLAEQDLRVIIQRDSQNAIALNALGYTLADRTDRQGEALRLIERALVLEPDNPAIQDSMGWVLFRLGQSEQALPYLERAADGDFHPEIVSHLIEVLWSLGREQEVQAWLAKAEPAFYDDPV
ncbi:MAG: tetratricopeptide repeat protein, partial [Pseudomonadota bacterium]